MAAPPYEEIEEIIEFRLNQVFELLNEFEFELNTCTPRELYDYLTGENFKETKMTFRDWIGNEYLLLHSIIEVSELKEAGVEIGPKTIMEASKEVLYGAHLKATDYELGYSLVLEDFYWLKHRLAYLVRDIKNDKYLPESLKERAMEIYDSFTDYKDF
ncbi:hypothetical protein MUP51_10415 [Candidatus Bathyarchaeota archaeon]|nr:hypothetical protein [Candidatus Bathyarchaeota archaeon]